MEPLSSLPRSQELAILSLNWATVTQSIPLYHFFNIQLNILFSAATGFAKWSLSLVFLPKHSRHLSYQFMKHSLPISHFLIWQFELNLVVIAEYAANLYSFSSSTPWPHSSYALISSSAPHCQKHSPYFAPSFWKTKFFVVIVSQKLISWLTAN